MCVDSYMGKGRSFSQREVWNVMGWVTLSLGLLPSSMGSRVLVLATDLWEKKKFGSFGVLAVFSVSVAHDSKILWESGRIFCMFGLTN